MKKEKATVFIGAVGNAMMGMLFGVVVCWILRLLQVPTWIANWTGAIIALCCATGLVIIYYCMILSGDLSRMEEKHHGK